MTHKPRVQGTQTAFVTAEPGAQGAEITVGGPPGAEIGCVRLKFHWDKETERHAKEPTSCWVRVSQVFAGVGEGAVWHPRVGVQVIVDFEDGDPDRPIVVGPVYNGQNRPPGGAPTVSTMKSMTSPGSNVVLDANALMKSNGGSQVFLDANALMQASGGGNAFCDANVSCSGATATIASTSGGGAEFTADVTVSGANVSISGGAKVGIAAPAVSSAAAGTNEITGAVVKIN